jgi:hypothetical protein
VLYPIPHREYPRFPRVRPREPAPLVGMAVKGAQDLPTTGYSLELVAKSSARPLPSTESSSHVAAHSAMHAARTEGQLQQDLASHPPRLQQSTAWPADTCDRGGGRIHTLDPKPRRDLIFLYLFGPLSRWSPCTSPSTIKGDPWPPEEGRAFTANTINTHTHTLSPQRLGSSFSLSRSLVFPPIRAFELG